VIKLPRFILMAISILVLGLILLSGCYPSSQGTTNSSGGFDWTIILFLVVLFALMYLLMIRPQRRRQKEQQKMIEELQRGDEIITTSGIYGKIEAIEDNSLIIKLEGGATMRILKAAVAGKKPAEQI